MTEQQAPAESQAPSMVDPVAAERDAARRQARFSAWMTFWTVVAGTTVVGLAGVLVPATINYVALLSDQQKTYQTHITSFLEKGINQDIELRLRLAGYFAELSGPEERLRWATYKEQLEKQRKSARERINTLEEDLASLCAKKDGVDTRVSIDRTRRELEWAYSEVGYAQANRSVMTSLDAQERRRRELYLETREVIAKLSALDVAIAKSSEQYRRFWELYRKDLIGIESREVALRMIEFGKQVDTWVQGASAPTDTYKDAERRVREQINDELEATSAPPVACGVFNGPKDRT